MKKIYLLFFSILLIMLFRFIIDYNFIKDSDQKTYFSSNTISVEFQSITDISLLQSESKSMGIELVQTYYNPSTDTIKIFTTYPERLSNLIVKGTSYINNSEYIDNKNDNISNAKKGQIKNLNINENIQIFNMTEIEHYPIDSVFYIDPEVTNEDLLLLKSTYQNETGNKITITNNSNNIFIEYISFKSNDLILIIISICTLLFMSQLITLNQTIQYGTKYIEGYSKFRNLLSIIYSEYLKSQIIAFTILTLFSIFILWIYNRYYVFYIGLQFIVLGFILQLTIFLLNFIVMFFSYYNVFIPKLFKGIARTRFITIITFLFKMLILFCLIIYYFQLIYANTSLKILKSNSNQWNILSDYGEFAVYSNDGLSDYELGEKFRKLFEIENKKGGILCRPSYTLIENGRVDESNPYFISENTLEVNNNYLKINPIRDSVGNYINISNEYQNEVTILIPEKYLIYENTIIRELEEVYTTRFYIDEDLYLYNKLIPHNTISIQIKYIENGQKCFSFNPNYGKNSYNYFYEPFIVIVNNVNFGGDLYYSSISNGEFKAYLNYNADIDNYKDELESLDLSNSVRDINNSYLLFKNTISDINNSILKSYLTLFILFIYFLLITLYSNKLIITANSSIITQKILEGFSNIQILKVIIVPQLILSITTLIFTNLLYLISFRLNLTIFSTFIILDTLIIIAEANYINHRIKYFIGG